MDAYSAEGQLGQAPDYALTLRDYQTRSVIDIRAAFTRHRRVCYVLPTGGGKTVIFSYLAWATARRGTRVMIVSHRQEIADQISEALNGMGVVHGQIRPGEPMSGAHVQVAMIQTLANRLARVEAPDLIILDEAHHATAGSWRAVLNTYPRAFVLGVTATPERLDGAGLREVGFEELVIGPDVRTLIERGYLAPFRYLGATLDVSFDDVHTVAGDYHAGEVEALLVSKKITGDIVAHYRKHLDGKTCICFTATVRHAESVAAAYRAAGIPAASIDGAMAKAERRASVEALRSGRIKVLTSCEVISEGFDAPSVGGCQLLRPTQSFGLFRQQIGRCLRPKPDGSPAIILDHVQNFQRHGLPDEAHEWSLDSEGRERSARIAAKPVRQCQACALVFPLHVRREPCPGIPGCTFIPKRVVESRPGELGEVVSATSLRDADLSWTEGVDIKLGRYKRLLTLAAGRHDRLSQIAAARGYKRGWIWHAVQAWARGERP